MNSRQWPTRLWLGAILAIALCGALRGAANHWFMPNSAEDDADFLQRFKGGALVISSGGSLPVEIRQRFIQLAGGHAARIVVIPAYPADAQQSAALRETWKPFGPTSVVVLQADNREESQSTDFSQPIADATGVWLTGGQQDWLASRYAGTPVEDALQELLKRGGVIGGSSAGAAVMTKVMIEQGLDTATLATGLDLLPGAIIDQHFLKRSRLNRLIRVLDEQPDLIGFGIDEGTALVVQLSKGRLGVLGNSYVMVCVPQTDSGERRLEAMKRGDQIDIESLRSGRVRISSPQDLESWLSDE